MPGAGKGELNGGGAVLDRPELGKLRSLPVRHQAPGMPPHPEVESDRPIALINFIITQKKRGDNPRATALHGFLKVESPAFPHPLTPAPGLGQRGKLGWEKAALPPSPTPNPIFEKAMDSPLAALAEDQRQEGLVSTVDDSG